MGRCVHFSCNPYFLSVSHCLPSYFFHASCCLPSYGILCPPCRVPTVLLSPLALHVRDTALALLGSYFPLVCCFLFLSPFISLSCRFMRFPSLVCLCCVRLPGVLLSFFFSFHISFCLPSYLFLVSPYVFLHIRCLDCLSQKK